VADEAARIDILAGILRDQNVIQAKASNGGEQEEAEKNEREKRGEELTP
jgi:hypothetical protein